MGWISVDEKLPLEEYKNVDCAVSDDFIVNIQPEDECDDVVVTVYQYSTRLGWCYIDGTPSPFHHLISDWQELPAPIKRK